nr:MAG TPA: hypothetical protein [Caudoviricetes sp.]
MDIEINEVQEIIKNLEGSGELSIKEEKYLKVAKLCMQLAAENVALKSKGKELLGEACAVYSKLNKLIDPSIGDFVDGQTLHEFQFVLDVETPATDRIVAEAEARGVEKAIAHLEKKFSNIGVQIMNLQWLADSLREGADK